MSETHTWEPDGDLRPEDYERALTLAALNHHVEHEWSRYAGYAWEQYQSRGRGAVVYDESEHVVFGRGVMRYVESDSLQDADVVSWLNGLGVDILQLQVSIGAYEPQSSIVVCFAPYVFQRRLLLMRLHPSFFGKLANGPDRIEACIETFELNPPPPEVTSTGETFNERADWVDSEESALEAFRRIIKGND